MIIPERILLIVFIVEAVLNVGFGISCTLKKSCKWKGCPFRSRNRRSLDIDRCHKCPYPFDEKERAEAQAAAEKWQELVELYNRQNQEEKPEQTDR